MIPQDGRGAGVSKLLWLGVSFKAVAGGQSSDSLTVHFPAVANANDNHNQAVVLNCVDNAVVSDTDSPVIPIAFQLFNSMRAGIINQGV